MIRKIKWKTDFPKKIEVLKPSEMLLQMESGIDLVEDYGGSRLG